jgi:hypothetical protein
VTTGAGGEKRAFLEADAKATLAAAAKDPRIANEVLALMPSLSAELGDVAAHAQNAWIARAAGDDQLVRAAMKKRAAEIEDQLLEGSRGSAIERLLAGRAALCWLQANYYDATADTRGDIEIPLAEFLLKRQDRAHRRYLVALKTLAEVRRLMVPAVQLNIGAKQLNLAGRSVALSDSPRALLGESTGAKVIDVKTKERT